MEAFLILLACAGSLVFAGLHALWSQKYFAPKPVDLEDLIAPAPVPEPTPEPTPEPEPEPIPVPIVVTAREKLYNVAYSCLGYDMAPTQDYVGCAEALSFVLKKAGVKGLPKGGILGTAELDKWLSKHLMRVDTPMFGDVAIAPTGTGNGTVRGHCWVVGKHNWMSNNSRTFLWDDHWKGSDAIAYYTKRGGLPMRYYRVR